MLDLCAEIGMAVEERVGNAGLFPDAEEVHGSAHLAEPADGGFGCIDLLRASPVGSSGQPFNAWVSRHDSTLAFLGGALGGERSLRILQLEFRPLRSLGRGRPRSWRLVGERLSLATALSKPHVSSGIA